MLFGNKVLGTVGYMGGVMALPEPFVWSYAQMVQYNNEYIAVPGSTIHYCRATASYHSFARNTLYDMIRGDWILMLDTDISFEPDLLARMLYFFNKDNLDVLTAVNQYKSHPHNPLLYKWNKKGNALEPLGKWDEIKGNYYIEVGSSGMGAILIRRSLLESMENKFHEKPFDIHAPFSEDHSFFWRLNEMKKKAYCNPRIQVRHLMYKELEWKDYDKNSILFSENYLR